MTNTTNNTNIDDTAAYSALSALNSTATDVEVTSVLSQFGADAVRNEILTLKNAYTDNLASLHEASSYGKLYSDSLEQIQALKEEQPESVSTSSMYKKLTKAYVGENNVYQGELTTIFPFSIEIGRTSSNLDGDLRPGGNLPSEFGTSVVSWM